MSSTLRSHALMLKWQALSNKPLLPLQAAVEIMIAVGFVIGLSFIYPSMTPDVARFLTTGAPALIILTAGLVMVPQIVAMSRIEGTFDYVWSLPVPRMAYLAADATVWIGVSLPGIILAVAIGSIYHGFSLQVSPLVVPAILLISLAGVFMGYSIAFGVPKPQMAQLASQVLVFFLMLFSPIYYPIEQLPGWLAMVHRVLPFKYMADLMRGTLTGMHVDLGLAFAVVGAWCLAGLILTNLIVRRRR